MKRSRIISLAAIVFSYLVLGPVVSPASDGTNPDKRSLQQEEEKPKTDSWVTVDHAKLKELDKDFKSGKDLTDTCLSCHNKTAEQFDHSIHWTWKAPSSTKDRIVGKGGHSINNFCVSTNFMHDRECLDCHVGWDRKTEAINCLNCHGDLSFNFEEAFEDIEAFLEEGDEESIEMARDIQHEVRQALHKIVLPTRKHCGSCHFYGGGWEGVKHGDLDKSLETPTKDLDVHMGIDGQNFQCTRCHTTRNHKIAGRMYSIPAATTRESLIENDLAPKITCESCHTDRPHKEGRSAGTLNGHTDVVACQSCHIPTFARKRSTQMDWDYRTAGKTRDGQKYIIKDADGRPVYMSIKGDFVWKKNVKPEYFWFNGSIANMTCKDVIDPSKTVWVSRPLGEPGDKKSRIFPFKNHTCTQPYDKVYKTILTAIYTEEDGGYWDTLDWNDAITKGQKYMGLPFSGQIGYVHTNYVLPTTHMVAPKEKAVKCIECHTRKDGRLAKIAGVYIPGRDGNRIVNTIGLLMVLGSLFGVIVHAIGRKIAGMVRKSVEQG